MFYNCWCLYALFALFHYGMSIEFSKFEKSQKVLLGKLHYPSSDEAETFPFRNKSLPIKDRVDDLVRTVRK